MTKEQFIKMSWTCGYGNKKQATEYCKEFPKDEYDDSDFVKLYQWSWQHHYKGATRMGGDYTTEKHGSRCRG